MAKDWLTTLLAGAALIAGCGGNAPATRTTLPPETSESQPDGRDQVITLDEQKFEGVFFEPQALPQAAMPGITGKRTVAEARKLFTRAKPADKVDEGLVLVSLLWKTPASRQEALKIVQELAQGDQGMEYVLFLLAVAEQGAGDMGRAAKAWDDLLTRFPTHKNAGVFRAYRAAMAMGQKDAAKAAELTAKVDPAAADTPAELAYVTAWVRLRQGDPKAAYEAMAAAAKTWTDSQTLPNVRRDLMVMAARSGADLDAVISVLQQTMARDRIDLAVLLDGLAEAYHYAGEYELRGKVLEKRAEGMSPAQLAMIRFLQEDVEYRLGRVELAVQRIQDAWDLAGKGGDIKPEDKESIAKRTLDLAKVYHAVYAKSFDQVYGDAARKLYNAYLAMPDRADAEAVKKDYVANLDALVADLASFQGMHDQEDIVRRVAARQQQIVSCYERALQADPGLGGKVTLTIDVLSAGKVGDVTTEPAAGAKGVPAVAGCLAERIKAWAFPRRTTPGLTRVVFPMAFSPLAR